jgi:hypothetical protein
VAGRARQCILVGLVEALSGCGCFEACVAYEVDRGNGEIDAVAARGPRAGCFTQARIPVGAGPSGRVAEGVYPVVNAAGAADFACFAQGAPPPLAECSVTAFPVLGSAGETLAVLSFYLPSGAAFPAALVEEISVVAAVAGRQLEVALDPAPPLAQPDLSLASLSAG